MSRHKPEACMTLFADFRATLALAPVATSAENVACHISIGRPLNYHDMRVRLYWKEAAAPAA
jgi:hypothetical protein